MGIFAISYVVGVLGEVYLLEGNVAEMVLFSPGK